MPCPGGCGEHRKKVAGANFFNPIEEPQPSTNDRGMYLMADDDYDCKPYHGSFTGTTIFVVGLGTEHERMFLRNRRGSALAYATENKLALAHLSVIQFCDERIRKLLGESAALPVG